MNSRWTRLKALKFPRTRLINLVVVCELCRDRTGLCWLLAEDEVYWETLGITKREEMASSGSSELLNLTGLR
jgi:hypothetical protein